MARIGVAGASILSLFMALAVPAAAQPMAPPIAEAFPACFDNQGTPVRYVSTAENVNISPLVYVAGARYLSANPVTGPAIAYDPDEIATMSPVGRAFVFAHECYHLSSGDAMEAYRLQNETGRYFTQEKREIIEANADCDAAHRMRDEYRFTLADMESMHEMIRKVTPDDEEERIAHIMACYADGPKI